MNQAEEDPWMKPNLDEHTTLVTADRPSSPRELYTCPMHPEVQQAGPGDCPKCGTRGLVSAPAPDLSCEEPPGQPRMTATIDPLGADPLGGGS